MYVFTLKSIYKILKKRTELGKDMKLRNYIINMK